MILLFQCSYNNYFENKGLNITLIENINVLINIELVIIVQLRLLTQNTVNRNVFFLEKISALSFPLLLTHYHGLCTCINNFLKKVGLGHVQKEFKRFMNYEKVT